MKIKILILPSVLILAFSAIAVYAVNWDNPSSQSIDQMLSGSTTGENNTPPGEYISPSAARSAESGQKGKDILNVPLGGKLDTTGNNPQDTRSQDQSQTSPVQKEAVNTTVSAPVQAVVTSEPASISGGWSLELTDSASHTAALTLTQSGDAVFGTGNVNLDANTTLMAAASGTLTGSKLTLDIVTLEKVNLYRLALTVNGESATGNYNAYRWSEASPSTGTAKGTRTVAP
jgi:hypothetical protein